jgi:hypothetical protein
MTTMPLVKQMLRDGHAAHRRAKSRRALPPFNGFATRQYNQPLKL